ncbi:MAG: hypothetical protein GF329_09880 [Candidatus Lokiarchaeota archaeon]|nr:hypothetical protein [Candidatus Lokiarchaeota archaeon]
MARGNKKCPFCRRNIRESDKFCPFCGKKVLNVSSGSKPVQKQKRQQKPIKREKEQPKEEPEQKQPEKPPEVDEEIPENVLNQLELRSEIKLIETKLESIRDEVEKLALKLTSDNTEGVEQKVQVLSDKIKELKAEKKELEERMIELPFEKIKNRREDWESRLAKLQNAFSLGEVSENAYNKLRDEYNEKLKELDQETDSQKVKINVWIRKMRLERDKLVEKVDLLKGRHLAGEFSDSEYQQEKEKLKNNIKKLETNIKILNQSI